MITTLPDEFKIIIDKEGEWTDGIITINEVDYAYV